MRLGIYRTALFMTLVGALSTFAVSLNAQTSARRYEVVDIGALTELPFSAGISVSNSGFVAGDASNGVDHQQGFLWREETGIQWLDHPVGDGDSVAFALNDAGQVVGTAFDASDGVLWNADGSLSHVFQSAVLGLNNFGVLTGFRDTLSSQIAFTWANSYTDVPLPASAISSQGYDVNDVLEVTGTLNGGQAIGAFEDAPAAFLWSPDSGLTTIITSPTFTHIAVQDLSNTGTVVGVGYWNGGAKSVAWKWDAPTGFSALGSLPSATSAIAFAVNDSGVTAGSSGASGVLWDEQGNIYKADDRLAPGFADWRIVALRGINNEGWLTGEALPPGSANTHAVMLRPIPVPEPDASGLILLSCVLLSARRRPREHSAAAAG